MMDRGFVTIATGAEWIHTILSKRSTDFTAFDRLFEFYAESLMKEQ